MADDTLSQRKRSRKKKPEAPDERAKRLAYMRAYYAANKDTQLAKQRADRRTNPSKYAEADRLKYLKNLERNRQTRRAYRAANLEKINAQRRVRYQRDRQAMLAANLDYKRRNKTKVLAKIREWQKNNPDLVRAYKLSNKAKRRGAGGSFPREWIILIRAAQRDRCAYCRDQLNGSGHVDHILAVANGGTNDRRNLQLTCQPCNLRKWKKDAIDFARDIGLLI